MQFLTLSLFRHCIWNDGHSSILICFDSLPTENWACRLIHGIFWRNWSHGRTRYWFFYLRSGRLLDNILHIRSSDDTISHSHNMRFAKAFGCQRALILGKHWSICWSYGRWRRIWGLQGWLLQLDLQSKSLMGFSDCHPFLRLLHLAWAYLESKGTRLWRH